MNDEEFEQKLQEAAGALRQSDPTRGWKLEILARARRERNAVPLRRALPPRWLVASWAAAWVVILGLNLTAPQDATAPAGRGLAETSERSGNPSLPTAGAPTLLAFYQHMNLNLDLPQ